MMRELAYSVVDVFADRPLEGNPLAVFHDGRGLSTDQMQALARETNLSETTFVLPADDPEEDRRDGLRVRIFTTQEELPFAGHPTLGTASWLRAHHEPVLGAPTVVLRLKVGSIPVRFDAEEPADHGPGPHGAGLYDAGLLGAGPYGAGLHGSGLYGSGLYSSMRQPDPEFGAVYEPAEVAAVLTLPESDLLEGFRPQTVSTGNPFCIVALRSVAALERLAIPQREASAWLRARGIRWFYCIAPEPDGSGWRARMQWYGGEDPATGSAAGPCIAWLVRQGLVEPAVPVTLRQGVEMLRPSRLTVQASRIGERITEVFVAGRTIFVAEGRFRLPL